MEPEVEYPIDFHTPRAMATLPQNWHWDSLSAVCIGVYDCPHSTPQLATVGPLLARSQDIRAGVFRAHEAAHVSEETYQERIARARPEYGDLLYSREGTYFGIAAEVPSNMRICLGQRMVLLRPDPAMMNSRYLRYWLNSPVMSRHLAGYRDGSVAERLNLPTIRGIPVAVPPLPEQHAIAHILGTLDDKIELNRRMNETLEAIARALFKSWFVDFDPVRAKAEGRQPAGMDAETAALFPDGFEESELGEVPHGWRVCEIGTVAGINERSIKAAYPHSVIDYIDIASVRIGELTDTTSYLLVEAPSRARRLVQHGDTIWSTVRPNLKAYLFIHEPASNLVVSTGFAVLTPHNIPPSYLYAWTTTDSFVDYLVSNADGSAYPAVRTDRFAHAPILCPPSAVLAAFESIVGAMRDRIAHNHRESKSLSAVRDTLLPKLLSGEIRVENVEKVVEEVTV